MQSCAACEWLPLPPLKGDSWGGQKEDCLILIFQETSHLWLFAWETKMQMKSSTLKKAKPGLKTVLLSTQTFLLSVSVWCGASAFTEHWSYVNEEPIFKHQVQILQELVIFMCSLLRLFFRVQEIKLPYRCRQCFVLAGYGLITLQNRVRYNPSLLTVLFTPSCH